MVPVRDDEGVVMVPGEVVGTGGRGEDDDGRSETIDVLAIVVALQGRAW